MHSNVLLSWTSRIVMKGQRIKPLDRMLHFAHSMCTFLSWPKAMTWKWKIRLVGSNIICSTYVGSLIPSKYFFKQLEISLVLGNQEWRESLRFLCRGSFTYWLREMVWFGNWHANRNRMQLCALPGTDLHSKWSEMLYCNWGLFILRLCCRKSSSESKRFAFTFNWHMRPLRTISQVFDPVSLL